MIRDAFGGLICVMGNKLIAAWVNSLSDESSVIPGSLGLLPSSSLAGAPDPKVSVMGLYEP